MTCGLPSGVTLKFIESGVEVIPSELTFESTRKEYRHARVRLNREAGMHVHDNALIPEPVEIWVADRRLARLYIPEDAIELKSDGQLVGGSAHIHLLDPRHALGSEKLDYKNENVTFGEVFDLFKSWILDDYKRSVNPHDVITDVRLADGADLGERSQTWDHKLDMAAGKLFWVPGVTSMGATTIMASELPVLRTAQNLALSAFDSATGLMGEDGGVDFEDITIAAALTQFEETFGVASWVDDEGVLWIGPYESQAEFYVAGNGPNMWNLREFNITEDPRKFTESYVYGDYEQRAPMDYKVTNTENNTDNEDFRMVGYAAVKPADDTEVYDTPIGEVTADEYYEVFGEYPDGYESKSAQESALWGNGYRQEGKTVVSEMRTKNGDALAKQAKRNLLDKMYDDKAGSLVINPMNSDPVSGYPHDVSVGDVIGAFPDPDPHCVEGEVSPGAFGVNRVQHRVTPQQGWTLTVDVGHIPKAPIVTQSFPLSLDDAAMFGNDAAEYHEAVRDSREGDWKDKLEETTRNAFGELVEYTSKTYPY